MKITGNTILITGGGSGIGRGLAEAFHKAGNQVIIGGRRLDVLKEAASANAGMAFVELDTTDRKSIEAAAADVLGRFPDLNVVVNNAGIQRVIDYSADIALDEKAISDEIDTNIRGVLQMIAVFLPHLKKQPSATIINLSSGLAFMPMARFPVYCATKAFVHSYSMSLRYQLKNTSVRVVELAPPWVATDLDASHETPTEHTNMSPMPLPEFIEAAMKDLASDRVELPVAGAKFLYEAGVSEKANSVFEQINA